MEELNEYEIDEKNGISVIKVKLNEDEKAWLKVGMETIKQIKISTALKQLAKIGYAEVAQNQKIKLFSETLCENLRRNKERGFSLDCNLKPIIRAKVAQKYINE
jgi:hypothetical protein